MGGRSKTAVIGSKRRPKRLKIHLDEILIHLDFFCVVRPFFFQNKNQQNHSPPRLENPGILFGDGGGKSLLFNFYIKERNQPTSKATNYSN